MKRYFIIGLFFFLGMPLLLPVPVQALTNTGNNSIKIAAGGFFPLMDDDNPTIQVANGMWTEAEYALSLTPSWEVGVQAGWGRSGISHKGQRLGHITMFPAAVFVRYRFFTKEKIVPFLFGGAGYSFNSSNKDTVDFDVDNQWLWRAGAGVDFFLTRSFVLRVDGRYQGTETLFSSGSFRHTIDLGAFVGTVGFVLYW
jgi:opacity protein-like surface antigen